MPLDLKELAARQLRDFDRRCPGTIFSEDIALDLAGAYALQAEVCRLREQRGERIIGYKVGCVSPAIQQQLNIGHPVFGRLFDSDSWVSGFEFSAAQFCNPAIEGELAVRLGQGLDANSTREEQANAIESVFAVIEMHNLVFRRAGGSAEELIANNAVHAGFVYPAETFRGLLDDADSLRIRIDDVSVAEAPGAELRRTILSSLNWLVRELDGHGLALLAGQTILCGSIAEVFPVASGSHIEVFTDRLGSVRCDLA